MDKRQRLIGPPVLPPVMPWPLAAAPLACLHAPGPAVMHPLLGSRIPLVEPTAVTAFGLPAVQHAFGVIAQEQSPPPLTWVDCHYDPKQGGVVNNKHSGS